MSETMLNTLAQDYLDLTLSKSRYDEIDIQWFTESPFWRRTSMRYSREYKILPDYEIGDLKHGKALRDILDESENLIGLLKAYRATAQEQELARIDYIIEHVTSVHVRAQLLSGQTMSYDEMTDGLYGLVAPEYDPKPMQDLLSDLQQALPGSGSVQEKIAAFRSRITVPTEHLLQVLTGATQFFHDETVRHMHVTGNSMPRVRVRALADPRSDFLSILFGYDYNHLEYERNFNTLVRWSADKIVECIGHEMEPGHLTYYEKRTQAMIDTAGEVTPAFGRGEVITVNGTPVELLLVKNPMGFRLSLASFKPEGCDTMICINDEYADGRDMSWLWDVDFTSLRGTGVKAVSGVRAWDMALRLEYDQVPVESVSTDLEESVVNFVNANSGTPKHIYCTYTAMLKTRAALAKIADVADAGVGK